MDKKIRMAFSGFLHGKRRAENAGEKPAIYTAPEVEICAYALENGFANTILRRDETVYVDMNEDATTTEANVDRWQETTDKWF